MLAVGDDAAAVVRSGCAFAALTPTLEGAFSVQDTDDFRDVFAAAMTRDHGRPRRQRPIAGGWGYATDVDDRAVPARNDRRWTRIAANTPTPPSKSNRLERCLSL
jgi:hypothetical protein